MITQNYNLNLIPNGVPVVVNASQYDKTARTINFALINGDTAFNVPSGSTVYVQGTKPDKTGYQYQCTYTDNVVSFDIKDQMTVCAGKHQAEIRITKNGEILGTANFEFFIEKAGLNDDTQISETDLPIVEHIIELVEEGKIMETVENPVAGNILTTDENGQANDSGFAKKILLSINEQATAGFHNSIYRGKSIQSYYDDGSLYKRINGTDGYELFEDLFIGDYFDITMPATSLSSAQTVRCLLAHFDYYLRSGDTETTFHHAVIVPFNSFANTAQIYASNINTSGYNGSVMHQTTLPIYKEALATIFGSHLKSFRDLLSTAGVTSGTSMAGAGFSGYSSGWGWQTVYLRLMSEPMVYGTTVFSSSFYDVGVAKTQLALFRLSPERIVARNGGVDISSRNAWWLSAVASGTDFASVSNYGYANYNNASNSRGVRPLWLLS